jgi:hypothetical protein
MWIPLITAHLQVDQPLSAISRLNPELQFNRSRNQYRRHFKVACITTYAFPFMAATLHLPALISESEPHLAAPVLIPRSLRNYSHNLPQF